MIRARYWIGALMVVAVIGYLAVTGANENLVTYVSIQDVLADPAMAQSSGVRIVGHVVEGSIQTDGPRKLWFDVTGEDATLRVFYGGVVPDTFKDGAEVVLEGVMADGHFKANTLLAKCPSKYEAEQTSSTGVPQGNGSGY